MDLERLKIDRKPRARRPRGAFGRLAPWLVLLALLLLGWTLRAPLLRRIDAFRLLEVRAYAVEESNAASAGAIRGTAANGYVVAARRAALSADTPGRVVALHVTEGSRVRAGEVVAELYAAEYEAAVHRAQADLASAQAELARAQAELDSVRAELEPLRGAVASAQAEQRAAAAESEWDRLEQGRIALLVEGRVFSERELDRARTSALGSLAREQAAQQAISNAQAAVASGESRALASERALEVARAQVEAQRAALELARATLDKTYVRAPFDGIVVLKDAEVGEVVSPNSQGGSNARGSIVTMVDLDSLEVQAEVPETSIKSVRPQGRASIFLDAHPETAYAGRIDRIWPTANRQKATIEVRVAFEAPDERLRPEMGVRVVFEPEEAEAQTQPAVLSGLVVPESTLVQLDGRWGVFRLDRDLARFQVLELGERRSGRVLVRGGLASGDRIVLDPPPELGDGERVRVLR